ncbi:MAG: hypothetical protein J6X69_09250, partial [Bacteroidales bacterium]|nr:hypothetical protein [Bacteroidales bacterium]
MKFSKIGLSRPVAIAVLSVSVLLLVLLLIPSREDSEDELPIGADSICLNVFSSNERSNLPGLDKRMAKFMRR